jgi:hypothetical protein
VRGTSTSLLTGRTIAPIRDVLCPLVDDLLLTCRIKAVGGETNTNAIARQASMYLRSSQHFHFGCLIRTLIHPTPSLQIGFVAAGSSGFPGAGRSLCVKLRTHWKRPVRGAFSRHLSAVRRFFVQKSSVNVTRQAAGTGSPQIRRSIAQTAAASDGSPPAASSSGRA